MSYATKAREVTLEQQKLDRNRRVYEFLHKLTANNQIQIIADNERVILSTEEMEELVGPIEKVILRRIHD